MAFDLGTISLETFWSSYWRRQPLHVPGGARRLLDPVEPSRFLAICEQLERSMPGVVFRRGPDLAFAQKLDLVDEPLRRVCNRFAGWLSGVQQIRFEGVYAREGMGIGSHFDIADTFLLQQRGTKLWRLHPPAFLDEESIRARLLEEFKVDAMYMPDGAIDIRLEEGDLLYLPLLWIHWGISEGESLSLSLAFTARLGLECLDLEGLASSDLLGERAAPDARAALWRTCYPRPSPLMVLPARKPSGAVRERVLREPLWWRPLPVLWTVEGEDAVEERSRVQAAQHVDAMAASLPELAKLWEGPAAQPSARAPQAPRQTRYGGAAVEQDAIAGFDELLRAASDLPDPSVDLRKLARPDLASSEMARLRSRVARRCMGRFTRIVQRSYEWAQAAESKATIRAVADVLARMPPERCAEALRHTALRGWSFRAAEAIQAGYMPRVEALIAHLPRLLAPSRDALTPAWPGGPPVGDEDDWIHGFFPARERAGGIVLLRGVGPEALVHALSAGRAWLASRWPAWEPWVDGAFDVVVLREATADEPRWESARGFPGLLATTPREPEATARGLLREAARRFAHDVLDGLSLVEETPREAFLAWTGRGASVSERLADLLVHALCLDVLPGSGSEIGTSTAATISALRTEPGLTEAGAALLDAIAQRLAERAERG
jgi:hypothetical protein